MAVPSSGSLSLFGIYKELTTNTYTTTYDGANNIGLRLASIGTYGTINTNSSTRPDGIAPHAISEFYGYDHDAATLYYFGLVTSQNIIAEFASLADACASTNTVYSCNYVQYNGTIGNGTILRFQCYTTTPWTGGTSGSWYRVGDISVSGCGTNTGSTYSTYVFQRNTSTGAVTNWQQCVYLTSYSSSVMGVFNQVCPFNGSNLALNQTYYHDGSGSTPTAGDTCYSDSAGNNVLAAGYYYLGGTGSGNRIHIKISGSNGVVDAFYPQTC